MTDMEQIQTGTIVKIIPCEVRLEYDIVGSWHVVMQHKGFDSHTIASLAYDYRYTSNSSLKKLAVDIALLLGAQEPVKTIHRKIGWEMPTREQALLQIQMLQEALPSLA